MLKAVREHTRITKKYWFMKKLHVQSCGNWDFDDFFFQNKWYWIMNDYYKQFEIIIFISETETHTIIYQPFVTVYFHKP